MLTYSALGACYAFLCVFAPSLSLNSLPLRSSSQVVVLDINIIELPYPLLRRQDDTKFHGSPYR